MLFNITELPPPYNATVNAGSPHLPTINESFPYPPRHLRRFPAWFYENADVFISHLGIVYGLHRIHFVQSKMFRQIFDINVAPYNTPLGITEELPIPFDRINGYSFHCILSLLYYPEEFKANEKQWKEIKNIGITWGMPHVVARAIRELDVYWREKHPQHLLRLDTSLKTWIEQETRRRCIREHCEIVFMEDSDTEIISDDSV